MFIFDVENIYLTIQYVKRVLILWAGQPYDFKKTMPPPQGKKGVFLTVPKDYKKREKIIFEVKTSISHRQLCSISCPISMSC